MYNWSTDTRVLKTDIEKYKIWKLEQLINFGLGGKKIKESELRKYWPRLQLDPARKFFLSFLLHGKKYSHQAASRSAPKRRA